MRKPPRFTKTEVKAAAAAAVEAGADVVIDYKTMQVSFRKATSDPSVTIIDDDDDAEGDRIARFGEDSLRTRRVEKHRA